MATDEKNKIYYEYRYLIDGNLKMHSLTEDEYEDLYYTGIGALFDLIDIYGDNIKHMDQKDFKISALFHIKSAINNILNERD